MPDEQAPVAIITAASAGLGAGVARLLCQRGYRVALMARSDAVKSLAAELNGLAVQGSLENASDIKRFVSTTMEAWGRIDAVVNNTGHAPQGELLSFSDEDWQQAYTLILASVIRLARHVTPIMKAAGGGSVVNISSYAAASPDIDLPLSSIFRAGLSAWTKLYAETVAPYAIRVNSILPGYINTKPQTSPDVSAIPLGRYGEVAEIAQTAAFLVSNEASYITGQNLLVDGGRTRSL